MLLRRLCPLVCRWALMWTGSPDAAEDVAQAVLLSVHRSIHSYTSRGRASTWVYRITRNALVDGERRNRRDERLRDRWKLDRLATEATDRDLSGSHDVKELLHGLMEELSPRQRAVLDLVDLQGFPATEVAEMLEVSPATVRVHLHRARQALRDLSSDLDSTATRGCAP